MKIMLLHIYSRIKNRVRKIYLDWNSKKYPIIQNIDLKYGIICNIKPETWETVWNESTYRLIKRFSMQMRHPNQNILLIENASVCYNSDIVITDDGVIWDKSYLDNFSKVIPLDSNLGRYDNGTITVYPLKKVETITGKTISLLGVHAHVWTHFFIQFLPKLYFAADAGLLDEQTTVLLPFYKDEHVNTVLKDYLNQFKNVSIIVAEKSTSYICEKLFFIPSASIISNHADYLLEYDVVIPNIVIQKLKSELVNRYVAKTIDDCNYDKKIYLVRRGTYRCMKNYQEAENFFTKKGFILVEPHKLSFEDKVKLFHDASEIVGPHSGAFTNIMFCNSNARILVFEPMVRTMDVYLSSLVLMAGTPRILQLTGYDCSSSIHPDYYVPISRIEAAYNELLEM